VGLLIAMLLLVSCGNAPLTGRKQMLLVSDSEVLSASLTQYDNYLKTAAKSTDKTKTAMVERIGKKIVAATEAYLKQNGLSSEIANLKWEFNLIKSDEINAFCMPGRKIVVYEGLLPLVASDDELWVVLGHEVAHVVAKHSNERMSQEILAQYGGALVDATLSEKSALIHTIGNTVFGLGSQLVVILHYSRKHELEADYMGLVFMTVAGYDHNKAVPFWQKMAAASGIGAPEFMSTHPNDSRRSRKYSAICPKWKNIKQNSDGDPEEKNLTISGLHFLLFQKKHLHLQPNLESFGALKA
jgi:predicted Zn-dependent protease